MGLSEKILAERVEEERRRGRTLGQFYSLNSQALDRLLVNAPKDRPGYSADLRKLHRYIRRGVHSPGAAMHFITLKAVHRREYVELKAEAQGQGELL
jgi:hypothetical protein